MSRDKDKLIRQLSLLSFLLSNPRPVTAREIQDSVEGYAEMSDETFTRRFHGDRVDLAKIGIDVRVLTGSEAVDASESQLYLLAEEDFRLPKVDFTVAELSALSLALAALDGRFAYARPLRLALTAICQGRQTGLQQELGHLPVALAPDEDARKAGKQLARLEDAVARGRTVCFVYPGSDPDAPALERTIDPYSLFLIQGHWYVVGRDHLRRALRTFRVTRIMGPVRYLTEKNRDFHTPADYDPALYKARPPWLLGPVVGTATIRVGDDLAWFVERLAPHVQTLDPDADGCARFLVAYADADLVLSWVVGLGGCGELTGPPELRDRLRERLARIRDNHEGEARSVEIRAAGAAAPAAAAPDTDDDPEPGSEPIAPERLARAVALLNYLVDPQRPAFVSWQAVKHDLGLDRAEAEADLSLINLANFGGGTYALTTETGSRGITVTREVMADAFVQPARLSPVMARALLLALDLLGDALSIPGLESLEPVRSKVHDLVGSTAQQGTVFVDEVLPPDHGVFDVLNRGVRDHLRVELSYYTVGRQEVTTRTVEPYLLFHDQEGWYLEAYCLLASGQRTFKLERIRTARLTADHYDPRPEVDLTTGRRGRAFAPADQASWATVRFHPRWRRYLEEHGLAPAPTADGALEARIPYADEAWMTGEVLRFLGDAVLVQPPTARARVAELAASLLLRYEDSGGLEASAPLTHIGGDA